MVRQLDGPPTLGSSTAYITSAQYLVVADDDVLARWNQVQKSAYGEQAGSLTYELDFNLDGTDAQKIACTDAIRGLSGLSASCRQKESAEFYAMLKVFGFYCVFTPVSTIAGNYLVGTLGWNEYLVTGLNMACNLVTEYLFDKYVVYHRTIDTNELAQKRLQKDAEPEEGNG